MAQATPLPTAFSGMSAVPKIKQEVVWPFAILKKISDVAFRLQLPEGTTNFPVFHAAWLKPFKGMETKGSNLELPPLSVDNNPLAWPEKIWMERQITRQGRKVRQLLIAWRGLPAEETSWEDFDFVKHIMPDSNLEDKVASVGGRDVTWPISIGESRRSDNSCDWKRPKTMRTRKMKDKWSCGVLVGLPKALRRQTLSSTN